MNLAKYRKAIVAAVGAAVLIATHFFGADSDVVFVIVTVASAAGVYFTPNSL